MLPGAHRPPVAAESRHTAAVPTTPKAALGPLLVAVLAGLAHLFVGFFYLTGGLVIPGPVLIPLWLLWLALAFWLVQLAVRRSWWTPVVPLTAAAFLVVLLVVGDQLLGWQA